MKQLKSDAVRLQTNSIVYLPKLITWLILALRFNKGYVVESKRGGGGYIRIMKVNLVDEMDILNALSDLVPEELSAREAIIYYKLIWKWADY